MTRRLLIDIGNTRTKWVVAEDAQLSVPCWAAHGTPPDTLLDAADGVAEAWVSDVTDGAEYRQLAAALRTRRHIEAYRAHVRAEFAGLRCAYAEPARFGVDRWLMLLAAWTRTHGAACVASAGTALTFDAVDTHGQHLGGCIAPGLLTMQRAVLDATAFAADAPSAGYIQELGQGLGRDTEACVRQGALHAAAGLLDRLARQYGMHGPRLLAGGDAEHLAPYLVPTWQHQPTLVLEGLLALATTANADPSFVKSGS
ncbi:MAG: type III pantothenate kinase [Nevskiaceae bacterium]|nr:MAG: type III pantothenate kinase [Nevskiaceae bacterium]TBR73550.1 MAG: type III pantothenate kinase [Nevskiaceae bacterium]